MAKNLNECEFDLRLIERKVRMGKTDAKSYQDYLKSLPDSATQLEYIQVFEDKDATIAENFEVDGLTFNP